MSLEKTHIHTQRVCRLRECLTRAADRKLKVKIKTKTSPTVVNDIW